MINKETILGILSGIKVRYVGWNSILETLESYTHLNVLVSFYADNDNEVSRPA